MKEVKLVRSLSVEVFEIKINSLLKEGYELYEGVKVMQLIRGEQIHYTQMMIKTTEQT